MFVVISVTVRRSDQSHAGEPATHLGNTQDVLVFTGDDDSFRSTFGPANYVVSLIHAIASFSSTFSYFCSTSCSCASKWMHSL